MPSVRTILSRLHALRTAFDAVSLKQKESLLVDIRSLSEESPKTLLGLHELLLFFEAHAHTDKFSETVHRKLNVLEGELKKRLKNPAVRAAENYSGSGVTSTHIQAAFSFTLIDWLYHTFPGHVKLDSIGAEPEEAFAIVLSLLPVPLRENLNDGGYESLDSWMNDSVGKDPGLRLGFLLDLFRETALSVSARDHLFERLGVYVDIDLHKVPSRTNLRLTIGDRFLHREPLIRTADCWAEILQPITAPVKLSAAQTKELVAIMRLQLIGLYRETDPATYADEKDVQLYDVGRGLCIALVGMKPERRQPVDAYIGFMAFKNGLPYAYGGAWMLGRTAKIGINVFPSFRGGESAWFFAQLMRVYYQVFRPVCFIAEPYQIGQGNPEGLETGAFWFYYKLGFRPRKSAFQQLAEKNYDNWLRPGNQKKKRAVLEELVEDEMILQIDPMESFSHNRIDTFRLSKSLTKHIRLHYKGNAIAFQHAAREHLKTSLGNIIPGAKNDKVNWQIEQLSLVLFAAGGISTWNKAEKSALIHLLEEKTAGKDSVFARLAAGHGRLDEALRGLCGSTGMG